MSPNVTPPDAASSSALMLLLAAVLSVGVSWFTASTSAASWDPPPPSVAEGVCAEACGIAACIAFELDTAEICVADLDDLSRAGPDPLCVQHCELQGAPPEVAWWLGELDVSMATR